MQKRSQNNESLSHKETRPVIYQLFPRLFANRNDSPIPNGRIETNGSGKINDITTEILHSIRDLSVTHIWYTGVIEHAHDVDYTRYGIKRHNPHIIKGRAGSPYAITDYYDIDPDLAVDVENRMDEFIALVDRTHHAGMKVIIDFVPNHVARQYESDSAPAGVRDLGDGDNPEMFFSASNNFYYITRQQFAPVDVDLGQNADRYIEFPAKATGNDCYTAFPGRNDWYETVKLNYGVDPADNSHHFDPIPDTWLKMLNILRFWAEKGVDGFRCDMAHMVPVEFWKWAISEVRKHYPTITFIAELYDVGIYRLYLDAGFDFLYDKVNTYDTLRGIVGGNVSAAQLTSCWQTVEGIGAKMLNFIENHDEQRFASEFYAGRSDIVVPSLTAVATMSKGAVMIYNGQELGEKGMDAEGFSGKDGRTTIFDYWSMDTIRRWLGTENSPSYDALSEDERRLRAIYSRILGMVNGCEPIRDGAFFDLMYVNYQSKGFNPHRHFVYLRSTSRESVLIFLNFDNIGCNATVNIPDLAFNMLRLPIGNVSATDLLDGTKYNLTLNPSNPVEIEVPAYNARILYFKHSLEKTQSKKSKNKTRDNGPSTKK